MEGSAVLSRREAARTRQDRLRSPFVQRYWAFLSYAHEDTATADWLHRALEAFRVPKGLIGRRAERFLIPARLTPIFRDRSELAASGDLSEDIQESLDSSRHLIVLCSPAAAQSRWVNEEIRTFKQFRPDGEVLAAIVGGEPWASNVPGREADECFPPALRERFDEDGQPTGEPAEPIAADLRLEGDGRERGLLKIVAGMLDLRLDDLVQRGEVERHRRWAVIASASAVGMLLTSGLAVTAIQSRDAARDQRREAEGLVGFMIGDLRDKLEPVGRLDALDAVGARVLAYYERQDKNDLPDPSLAQRSKALTLMGDIAQQRGDLDGALRRYREAAASTSELLTRHPQQTQRMFDHAQNLFFLGSIAWHRGRIDEAASAFRGYKRLAKQMISLEPRRKEWRLEGIYADANLGNVLLANDRFEEAAGLFAGSLPAIERLTAAEPGNPDYQYQLLETLAYLSDARLDGGALREAIGDRERQIALIDRFATGRPNDMELRRKKMVAHQALARLFLMTGEVERAAQNVSTATRIAAGLTTTDPGNAEWADRVARTHFRAADVALAQSQPAAAASQTAKGCRIVEGLMARDPSVVDWSGALRRRCLLQRAIIELRGGSAEAALALAGQTLSNSRGSIQQQSRERRDAIQAQLISGDALVRLGRRKEAAEQWRAGLIGAPPRTPSVEELAMRAILLRRTGQTEEAKALTERLHAIGFRHPAYARAMQEESG
jgi:eukaryotic-like serine/threonine-protein kinase